MLDALTERFADWRLGIRTRRSTPAIGGGAKAGDPTPYPALFRAARTLGPADVVYDVGCGSGRACAVFATTGARVTGIELSAEAAGIARRNRVTVIVGDARSADYASVTALWMFNPFGPEALRAVLRRANSPRVLYYNASDQHRAVLFDEGYAAHDSTLVGDYALLDCRRTG